MSINVRRYYLKKDPELMVVHVTTKCPAAAVGVKYGYLINISLATVEEAAALDEEGYRACDWCLNRERKNRENARRVPHISPPGFRH